MLLPPAPDHMWRFRGQTIQHFGYDTETQVRYKFNSLGYRSDTEFDGTKSPIIVLGNTISFGLGLETHESYAGIIGVHMQSPVYNFAWGCYLHTNAQQLKLLKQILLVLQPRLVIFQINNLDRLCENHVVTTDNPQDKVIAEFETFRDELVQILSSLPHVLLYWDEKQYSVSLPRLVIHNKYHVDSSLQSNALTFGPGSHRLIAYSILKEIK